MAFDKTDDFSFELSDADLEEINGGLSLTRPFPLGTIDPFVLDSQISKELLILSKGIPNPIQNMKNISNGF